MKNELKIIVFIFLIACLGACGDKSGNDSIEDGKLQVQFTHKVDGKVVEFDQLIYTNEAGNQYLINEIQYFISDVTLKNDDGAEILNDWEDVIYVDTDIEQSLSHHFPDKIKPGKYHTVTFIFGIDEERNQSLSYVNPPESLMFWPELLGGGYHYMKLNGKWLDTLDQISPFNFHLGIGQIYVSFPDEIETYIHNYFTVELSGLNIEIKPGETSSLNLVMQIENWFKEPNTYDHNNWGGDIMQKQDAMKAACENGHNVFTID